MKSTYVYIGLVILLIGGLVFVRNNTAGAPGKVTKYDDFAACLGNAGAKFYGAYWCPHCKEQKALFENSTKLPYNECGVAGNTNAQTQACTDLGIKSYPTWFFADGSKVEQVVPLATLAEKTSCELPAT